MKNMVIEYSKSCEKLKKRIKELSNLRLDLLKSGKNDRVEKLDLDRRIQILYTEQRQTKEVMLYLLSYIRRVEERGEETKFV